MSTETYRVFTRRPWKRNPAYPQGWEPHGGAKKRTVARGITLEEARRLCAEANKDKPRGKAGLSWTEFEREEGSR